MKTVKVEIEAVMRTYLTVAVVVSVPDDASEEDLEDIFHLLREEADRGDFVQDEEVGNYELVETRVTTVTQAAIWTAARGGDGEWAVSKVSMPMKVEEGIQPGQAQARPKGPTDPWGEDERFPREEWRGEVWSRSTSLGYWDWVEAQYDADEEVAGKMKDEPR